MGITGAPFGRTELLVPPGAGALEKNAKMLHLFDICFDNFDKNKKLTKSAKFARIGLISIQNESPHRVLDSSGGFGKKIKKKGGT